MSTESDQTAGASRRAPPAPTPPAPTPPPDPRAGWDLPAFGALPARSRLDELTERVLAPNPSPMTLDGTNTYVVGEPGHGRVAVVDPGPDLVAHRAQVDRTVLDQDAEVVAVLVTHHHPDHAEAARAWAAGYGCPVVAATREVAGEDGRTVGDGETIVVGSVAIEVVATPGHTRDHLAFRLPTGALLVGDHVLGRGTSVVVHPDGDLLAYLDSLRRVLDLGPDALFPGHGPELVEDPMAVLRYYRDHRRFREHQLLTALGSGPASVAQLVACIYHDVDRRLWPAAAASTRAALAALAAEGRITWYDDLARLVHTT